MGILVFGNQRIASLIAGLLALYLIYAVTIRTSRSQLAGGVALLLTVTNVLYRKQLFESPELDIFQLVFLLCVFLFVTKDKYISYKTAIIIGVASGAFASIKVFAINAVFIWVVIATYIFLNRKRIVKPLYKLTLFSLTLGAIYAATYARYFMLGGTLRSFLGVQKWIITFYQSSRIDMSRLYGNYLRLIMRNEWRVWGEGYPLVPSSDWSIMWPLAFIAGFVAMGVLYLKKDTNKSWYIIATTIMAYNAYLYIVPVFPRYLLLLFVPMNMLIGTAVARAYEKAHK